jgi:glyoxylase-like metal-dependent hydrolase (beta-lactamase superfamily II)
MNNNIHVLPFTLGEYQTNSYLIYGVVPKEAIVIDAGFKIDSLIKEVKKMGLSITHLLLTHGHIDHIDGIEKIVKEFGSKLYCYEDEVELLADSEKNLSLYTEKFISIKNFEKKLKDEEIITLSGIEFKVIHTPGHTSGSCSFLMGDKLFTGDTLFAGSYGRYDLPTGNVDDLINSIQLKLFTLDEEIRVYPGHGPGTILKDEINENPINSLM